MNELSIILAGFSAVSCCLLFFVYLFYLPDMQKTAAGKVACGGLLLTLAALQVTHVSSFMHGTDLLSSRLYAVFLAAVPVMLYFFSRELLFHGAKPVVRDLLHVLPLLLVLVLPISMAPLAAFLLGCCYTFYILRKVLALRRHLPRFRFEKFFFGLFFAMTLVALILGLSLSFIDHSLFYHGYAGCISIAMVLVITALLAFPELLSDVLLASESAYAKTRLAGVNIADSAEQLERLMHDGHFYENENLTLGAVAEELGLTGHQLSELVNTRFSLSFPRYIRQHRIEAAKRLLLAEPHASVLSISLATGFKSQSSFYTAFREITGQSPAVFRKSEL